MNTPIYEIFLEQEKKTLVFCSEENFDKSQNSSDHICVNMYIYDDDIVTDVLNKIKISMIKYISKYNKIDFEQIAGYLIADWNYYNESFKIKEYLYLNIFGNKLNCDKVELVSKLSHINKKYNKIDELDEIIEVENININEIVGENDKNNLVVGYYNRKNDFIYYISENYMESLIEYNGIIENELNKPINNYNNYYIDKDDVCVKNIIRTFTFKLVDNDVFKRLNNISLPKYIKNISTQENLEHIYNVDFKNREKINTVNSNIENFKNKLLANIIYLSLEIKHVEKNDLTNIFNKTLNENCPFSMISKDKTKKYKLFKKSNKLPYIKQEKLEKIIDYAEKNKEGKGGKNYVLFKIFYKTLENNNTDHLIDVYFYENNSFYIKFDVSITKNMDAIIFNINNILSILGLQIGERSVITESLFYYYNNSNTILINNNTDYSSSDFNLILNYIDLDNRDTPNWISHKFLSFILLFHTLFDIDISSLQLIYKESLAIVNNIILEEDKLFFKKRKTPLTLSDIEKILFKIENITLFYKKSYYYDSYNYIEKYFKYVSTFDKHNVVRLGCNLNSGTKSKERYENFLKYGKFESGYSSRTEGDFNIIEEILNKTNMENCKYILDKVNEKTNLKISIDNGIFYMNVKNISSFIELENLYNTFQNFINYTDHYESLFKLDLETRLEIPVFSNIYHNKGGNIYNMYNNIFNNHNSLISNNNSTNEYYLFIILNTLYNNTEFKTETIDKFSGDFSASESDDEESEDEDEDESDAELEQEIEEKIELEKNKNDPNINEDELKIKEELLNEGKNINLDEDEIYKDEKSYKLKYNNVDKPIWANYFKNFNENCTKSCVKHSRPSMIDKTVFRKILSKEENNKIKIKNKTESLRSFTDMYDDVHNNKKCIIDNNKSSIEIKDKNNEDDIYYLNDNILIMHMGRDYRFDIKYENGYVNKLVLLFSEDSFNYGDENDTILEPNYEDIKNENCHFEIYSSKFNKRLSYEEYLESNETEFYFNMNFQHNLIHKISEEKYIRDYIFDDKSIEKRYKMPKYNKQYRLAFSNDLKNYRSIHLYRPYNFYFDKYIFGDFYYIYLPSKSIAADRGDDWHPYVYDDIICCYSWDKSGPQGDGEGFTKGVNKPVSSKKEDLSNPDNFRLRPFKLAILPESIYSKMCKFLSIENYSDYFKPKQLVKSGQIYRFEILFSNKINKFLNCIFKIITMELSNIGLSDEIKTYFNFKNITPDNIKKSLTKIIQNEKIINNSQLRKLNNNIFYKNDKLKFLTKKIRLLDEKLKAENITEATKNTEYQNIRQGIIKYIEDTFLNMDMNFIWNLCSIIFNINIIIIELKFTHELTSNIKCPLMTNVDLYNFKDRKTCFIFNYETIYQPLVIPLQEGNNFNYKMLFDIKNKDRDSITNLHNIFDKCLLKYNDTYYNNLLINSIYHNIDYSDNIVLDTYELFLMKEHIKYIVINEDYIKLGVIFEIDDKFLFIPINYIKHNINYNIIEKDYKFIYKTESELDKGFIHNFEDTKILISKLVEKCKNEKFNINKKYITNGKHIIGIGLHIGDYVPIIKTDITAIDKLDSDEILSDISYINNIDDSNEKKIIYNKFEYTNLYYQQFTNSISDILYSSKIELEKIINEENDIEDKKNTLKRYLNKLIRELFSFQEHMYLKDQKPTYNIINNFRMCHTLNTDQECNENCILEESEDQEKKCKYIITEYYYDLFLVFLVNELVFNNYKKVTLLNGIKNKLETSLDEDKYILLDDIDPKNKHIIYNLYNKIMTDNHHYSIGSDYNQTDLNIKTDNSTSENFCTIEKYIDELDLSYYTFKSLTKMNIISYSNCIYYNLSRKYLDKHKTLNYVDNIRSIIASNIIDEIRNGKYDIHDIKNYYISQNNTHLYSNITNINDLKDVIVSYKHWITELDLYVFSLHIEKKILFYKKNIETKGHYMIMNEQFTDEIKIYVEPFYYRNLYYLIKN
tara:strand:+ start:3494 stop:9379 length:5886 start_codon:yes stop_codon:yes gene_type:complete